MSHFVERLEDELVRAGFGRRARLRRARRPALQVSSTVMIVLATLLVMRPGIEREHEATPAPTAVACAGTAVPVTGAVDAGLLTLLGTLRNPPPAQQTASAAACAERSVQAGGPAIGGAARWVAPGLGRGSIYLVAVPHWAAAAGTMSDQAKARFAQPGACLTSVAGLRFDPAGHCFSVEQIADAEAVATTEIPTSGDAAKELARAGLPANLRRGSYVSLVVPDGVAEVELRYSDGHAVRQRVNHNAVIAHSPRSAPAAMPSSIVYFDTTGAPCGRSCTGRTDPPGAPAYDLPEAIQRLQGAPAPLAELHAQANTLLGGGRPAFEKRLAALKGHPIVIHKWASWCAPCQAEFGIFEAVGTERGKDVAFLGINGEDKETSATSLLARRWLPFPSYRDPEGDIAHAVGAAEGYPMTVFVDQDGKTVETHVGPYTSEQQLDDDIDHAFKR